MVIVLGAVVLQPHRIVVAAVALGDAPGSRKGVVNDGDLVVERVRVGLVEIEALLDDGLVVLMKRHTSAFVSARSLKTACLDLRIHPARTAGSRLAVFKRDGAIHWTLACRSLRRASDRDAGRTILRCDGATGCRSGRG